MIQFLLNTQDTIIRLEARKDIFLQSKPFIVLTKVKRLSMCQSQRKSWWGQYRVPLSLVSSPVSGCILLSLSRLKFIKSYFREDLSLASHTGPSVWVRLSSPIQFSWILSSAWETQSTSRSLRLFIFNFLEKNQEKQWLWKTY